MNVKKRNGKSEKLNVDKINKCVMRACEGLEDVFPSEIVLDAHVSLYDGVTTEEIDRALILSARSKIEKEPNYTYAAARMLLNCLYKESFGEGVDIDTFDLQYKKAFISNLKKLVKADRVNPKLLDYDLKRLSDVLKPENDLKFKYLGIQTLADRYFIHINKRRMETPQAFWMRVAMGLALNEENKEEKAIEFYEVMSNFHYTPSTPTLFNSGTLHSQLSSCYLNTFDDSIDGIFDGLWQEARKSKYAGGLGFDVTPFRGTGAYIKGTNGEGQGLIPWLKLFNDTLCAVNQGGKRKGAGCAYLEIWHLDYEEFLDLRKNTGDDRRRCHDMNTASWIPDLFFKFLEENKDWYLFNPSEAKDLHEIYGDAFNKRYMEYIQKAEAGEMKCFRKIEAKALWKKMLTAIFETGHPWMTFKDPSNMRYSNQHQGTVHSSNLCTEILLHTKASVYREGKKLEPGETAVCNLGSINIVAHVVNGKIDWKKVEKTCKTAIRMLDNVIDINFYPTQEAENSNLRHRPIGFGSMGLVDAMRECGISYEDAESIKFSSDIQEFISLCAIEASSDLAAERGKYPTYEGSLWSKGILPPDTYNTLMQYRGETPRVDTTKSKWADKWTEVRKKVSTQGMRNSNTMAIAPTATISYILGCSQSVEPDFSVLFVYSTLSGEFTMINEYFVKKAKKMGLWGQELLNSLKIADGDVSKINLPDELKKGFTSAFNLDQNRLIDCAAARQIWLDMGQSLNLYTNKSSLKSLSDMYKHAWKTGLKTTYYLRAQSASKVEKSTVEKTEKKEYTPEQKNACSIEAMRNGGSCEACQ